MTISYGQVAHHFKALFQVKCRKFGLKRMCLTRMAAG